MAHLHVVPGLLTQCSRQRHPESHIPSPSSQLLSMFSCGVVFCTNLRFHKLIISCLFPGVPTLRFLNNFFLALQIFEVILVLGVIFALFTQFSDFRLQGDQSLAFSSDFYAINPKTCVIFGLFIA